VLRCSPTSWGVPTWTASPTYLHLEYVGPSRIYLVAAIDLSGDRAEHDLAVRLRRVERDLEQDDKIEEAVLTLSTVDERSLS